MTYIIRKATNDDSTSLTKLMQDHAAYEGHTLIMSDQTQKLSHLESVPAAIFVAVTQGQVCGYMSILEQFSSWDMDWYLYLDCLYLNKQARGQSLGLQMMQTLKQHATDKGISTIQWQTPVENIPAIGFYEKLGAVGKHKQRFFWNV